MKLASVNRDYPFIRILQLQFSIRYGIIPPLIIVISAQEVNRLMFTIILFIIVLSILVVVHEFGHFIAARKSGMKVYEFGMGFPPRVFGVYKDPKTKRFVWVVRRASEHKRQVIGDTVIDDKISHITHHISPESTLTNTVGGGEKEEEFPATLYSFNWLPLGGFCKIKGENGEEAAQPDSFGYHKAWKRLVVLVAGVTMNFLLAAVLLGIGFMIGLPADLSGDIDKRAIVVEPAKVMVQQVEKDSPADHAGMKFGDTVISINGEEIKSKNQMVEYVKARGGVELQVVVEREEKSETLRMTPRSLTPGDETPRIGVFLADAGVIRYPWYLAILKGFVAAWYGLLNIFIAFFLLIKGLIMGRGLAFDVSGPVGIAVVVGQSAKMGINYLINVTAMISLSLAAINILPIPALDGGRALFVVIEKIFRKPVPMKYEQIAHTIGFVLLMLLIVVVTGRDVLNLF